MSAWLRLLLLERKGEQKSMNTMIISAFPACGKTYLYENQDTLEFKYLRKKKKFTFRDSDSSKYEKTEGWEKVYVDDIQNSLGKVDFIFISQHEKVLQELNSREIPFIIISPNNSEWISDTERKFIKQQWFGRFVLRDNSHIKDFNNWLKLLKDKYDEWTSLEHLMKYGPASFELLKQDEYISDIIEILFFF